MRFKGLLVASLLLLTGVHAAEEFTVVSVIPSNRERPAPTAKGKIKLPFDLPEYAADSPQIITIRVSHHKLGMFIPTPSFISSLGPLAEKWKPQVSVLTIKGDAGSEGWITLVYNPDSAHPKRKNATPRILFAQPLTLSSADQTLLAESGCTDRLFWITVNIAADGSASLDTVHLPGGDAVLPVIKPKIETWKFAPARQDGKPITSSLRVPVPVPHSRLAKSSGSVPKPQAAPVDTRVTKWLKVLIREYDKTLDEPLVFTQFPDTAALNLDLESLTVPPTTKGNLSSSTPRFLGEYQLKIADDGSVDGIVSQHPKYSTQKKLKESRWVGNLRRPCTTGNPRP